MKIKFKDSFCQYNIGDITDALILKCGNAWVLDSNYSIQYASRTQFDIVQEEPQPKQPVVVSLRDLLGQDVKSLEFK